MRRTLIQGIALLAISVSCVWTAKADEVLRAKCQQVIADLDSQDYRVASKAAQDAADCPYQEVAAKLIAALSRTDIQAGNQSYGFVVSYAIESLGKNGTLYEVQNLAQQRKNIDRLLNGNKIGPRVMGQFDSILAVMQSRSTPLASIQVATAAPPPNTANTPATTAGPQPAAALKHKRVAERLKEKYDERVKDIANDAEQKQKQRPNDKKQIQDEKTLADGVAKAEFEEAAKLLGAIEGNLYDDAMNLKNAGKPLAKFSHRDDALERLLQAMLRRDKSHVLLLGKAGVGKTTLVRMLQNGWIEKEFSHPGNEIPLIMELSILDVTNPSDPTAIKKQIISAKAMASILDCDLILFLDESQVSTPISRNAIKSFLTQANEAGGNRVHFIWATTSDESKFLTSDAAFSRRWIEINLDEFNDAQAIEAVTLANVPAWQAKHKRGGVSFSAISPEAYNFANRYRRMEQPHAGNPTGLKELLEGSIVFRLRQLETLENRGELAADQKAFTLEAGDIRNYLKFQKGLKLIPGDAEFEAVFDEMWKSFRNDYQGQDGGMVNLKHWLRSHFSTLDRDMLLVLTNFGPPGGGKTYLAEMLAKHFYNGSLLPINSGMFSEGDFPLNTLLGSPTGVVGSEEQRGMLPKFVRENPNGGVIVFEEADYLPQQVIDFLIDTITRKEFTDQLGQVWRMDNFVIQMNSNIGQEYLIPTDMRTKMTWEEYNSRRMAITQKMYVEGQEVSVVRPDKLDDVLQQFVKAIAKGRGGGETNSAPQEQKGMKLKRRIKSMYTLLPEYEELKNLGHKLVQDYIQEKQEQYNVTFTVNPESVDAILDLEHYRFEEGYTYVRSKLDLKLFSYLNLYLDRKGQTLDFKVEPEQVKMGRRTVESQKLVIKGPELDVEFSLGQAFGGSDNQWFANLAMRERVKAYPREMAKRIKGQKQQIEYMSELLKQKVNNWNTKLNIAQIGTSGNGKTEFGYATAEVLFGSRKAAFKIAGINTWADLQNYFRSPVGFVGSNEVTEFEKWFMTRLNAGGGVIILDELLSFSGLTQGAVAEKINAINKLFDLLDERIVSFKGRPEDARSFICVITGNSMQEMFAGIDDSPEAEYMVRRILERIAPDDIVQFFQQVGLGAPQLARFGKIFVNGPLDKATTVSVGLKETRRAIQDSTEEISQIYQVQVDVDPQMVAQIVDRVTTVKLGLRHVNRAIDQIISQPITGILNDLDGATEIVGKYVDGEVQWWVDGKRVRRVGHKIEDSEAEFHEWVWETEIPKDARESTPQMKDVQSEPKMKVTDENLRVVFVHEALGHWRTNVLINGESSAVSISLIPADGSLGRVMSDNKDVIEVKALNELLKEITFLEAGHRAVFIDGYYSVGGGGSGDPEEKRRNDDLFKVNRLLDATMSNNLFEDFTEFGDPRDKALFRDFMRRVGKGMADRVVRYGNRLPVFEPFFETLLKKRFVGEETIKSFLASIKPGQLPDPDLLTFRALMGAVRSSLSSAFSQPRSVPERVKIAALARELLNKSAREIRTKRRSDPPVLARLRVLQTQALADVEAIIDGSAASPRVSGCKSLLLPSEGV